MVKAIFYHLGGASSIECIVSVVSVSIDSSIIENVWNKVVIPVPGSFDEVRFSSAVGTDQPTMYLDEIVLK